MSDLELSDSYVHIGGYEARTIRLPVEAEAAVESARRAFVAKFGREPGPDDPVFFNPDADEPEPMTAEQVAAISALLDRLGYSREHAEARLEEVGAIERHVPKRSRNEPCPCGSGLKWKRCHGA
jgi:hypothetical protein